MKIINYGIGVQYATADLDVISVGARYVRSPTKNKVYNHKEMLSQNKRTIIFDGCTYFTFQIRHNLRPIAIGMILKNSHANAPAHIKP
jgi:hypothetical protein